jgi:hypothetical protein
MKLSYSAVWQRSSTLLRDNASLIIPVAGIFMFLPALLAGYFLPFPKPQRPEQIGPLLGAYLSANFHWLLLANLLNMAGSLSILSIVLDKDKHTVANAIGRAVALLPFYFLAMLLWWILICLAILPGLLLGALAEAMTIPFARLTLLIVIACFIYAYGRTALMGPIMVADQRRNPIAPLLDSFRLTDGNGWAAGGLVTIVFVVLCIAYFALIAALGTLLLLVAGEELGGLLMLLVAAALSTAIYVVLTVIYAAIFRELSRADSAGAAD